MALQCLMNTVLVIFLLQGRPWDLTGRLAQFTLSQALMILLVIIAMLSYLIITFLLELRLESVTIEIFL